MNAVDVLKAARAKIEQGWTQGAWARNARGVEMGGFVAGPPTCWCAYGAIVDCHHDPDNPDARFDAERILERAIGSGIAEWNDNPKRTKAEVLKAFDDAIQLAEQQP